MFTKTINIKYNSRVKNYIATHTAWYITIEYSLRKLFYIAAYIVTVETFYIAVYIA